MINFSELSNSCNNNDGIVHVGGELSTENLLNSYSSGVFPWFSDNLPVIWWNPDPRMVLYPKKIKLSKSLKKTIKNTDYKLSINKNFDFVINNCSRKLTHQSEDIWITGKMINAYTKLFELGYAHSIEISENNKILGGLYGVSLGKIFYGESMFSMKNDFSKIALFELTKLLIKYDFKMIDCQVASNHLSSMGAENISRNLFLKIIKDNVNQLEKTKFE
jgi:leucyl/phenylalanyl-tRNA--protein transferase